MDPMPLDFTQYLSNRFGLTESATNELLGSWLKTYEPEAVRREREERALVCQRQTSESCSVAAE